jgi:hypothetical protein
MDSTDNAFLWWLWKLSELMDENEGGFGSKAESLAGVSPTVTAAEGNGSEVSWSMPSES